MKQTLLYLLVIISLSSCANYHSHIHFSKEAQLQKKEILETTSQQTEQTEARVHHSIKEEKAKITQAQNEEKNEKEQVRPEEKFISNRGEDTYVHDNYSEIEKVETKVETKSFNTAQPRRDGAELLGPASFILFFVNIILPGLAAVAGIVVGIMALQRSRPNDKEGSLQCSVLFSIPY